MQQTKFVLPRGETAAVFIVDAQKDFMDMTPTADFTPALPVEGACEDMERLAAVITAQRRNISEIMVTMDSHNVIDVGHPSMWIGKDGKHPAPYTIITLQDLENGTWRCRHPGYAKHFLKYAEYLEQTKQYAIIVWPQHCVPGTTGHNLYPAIHQAISAWEIERFATVTRIVKGTNPLVESFSAFEAAMPMGNDPSTHLDSDLIVKLFGTYNRVFIGGEALSHCVNYTMTSVFNNLPADILPNLYLITDCMSNVPGFEAQGQAFLDDAKNRGVNLVTSDFFL